jgi:uncharacterized RDD family membrane protein YckC
VTNSNDPLQQEYTIETPENVSYGYDVAGIGSRFIGALIDTFIIFLFLGAIDFMLFVVILTAGGERIFESGLEADIGWIAGALVGLFVLLQFIIFWGYYMVFELVWNGQSPGKRAAKTRVVRMDGDPPGFIDVAVRNLVRIVDFLPTAYGIGLVTMFTNGQARRLGDFAAGTLVVRERSHVKLDALGCEPAPRQSFIVAGQAEASASAHSSEFPALRRMTTSDYELVHDTLLRAEQGALSPSLLRRVAVVMAARVEAQPPVDQHHFNLSFLQRMETAYRTQR